MDSNEDTHKISNLLRTERLPTPWCPGCGVGITVNAFLQAFEKSRRDQAEIRIISSEIGCTGKIAQYLRFPWSPAPQGEVFSTASEVRQKKPDTRIVIFLQDGDFLAAGVNSLLGASQKGEPFVVVFINSYIYNLLIYDKKTRPLPFQKQLAPKDLESPYNMPLLMERNGACFVARWTPLHVRRLSKSIQEALSKEGLSFIEVLSPCLMYIASEGKLGWKIDRMGTFYTDTEIRGTAPDLDLDTRLRSPMIIGKFTDR
jgi:2-oxoglutarate ferredoxin oxidoreductase subunit beta